MIDTKEIRMRPDKFVAHKELEIEERKKLILLLCDSHEELELEVEKMKSKIAEDVMIKAELANDCDTYISDIKRFESLSKDLERKLKISEDALSFYAKQETWVPKEANGGELISQADIFGATIAFKALKQIRG